MMALIAAVIFTPSERAPLREATAVVAASPFDSGTELAIDAGSEEVKEAPEEQSLDVQASDPDGNPVVGATVELFGDAESSVLFEELESKACLPISEVDGWLAQLTDAPPGRTTAA